VNMTLSPPWVPNLSASDDCSYFDPDLRAEDESKDSSKSGAAAGSSTTTKTVKGVYTQGKGTPTPKVCMHVLTTAPFPQRKGYADSQCLHPRSLACMRVLTTAPFPHRQADSQVCSRGGGGVGEALHGLRDALLSAVVGAEVSAMVSAISRGRRPRRRGVERHGERHLPWPTPMTARSERHGERHLPWTAPTTAPKHGRSCFGPRRAGAAALVELRVGDGVIRSPRGRSRCGSCAGRPLRSVHGPSASTTT